MPIFRANPGLLRRFREGDPQALEDVYRAYVRKIANIVRFGFRLPELGLQAPGLGGHPDEVADTVQEIFTKSFAVSARQAFDADREYGPYLYAIARNAIADRARRARRELPMPEVDLARMRDAEIVPIEEGPSWADDSSLAVVREYLATLDGDLRRVHQARFIDGLSQHKTAEVLQIGRQTVRTLEARLRDGLRRALAARAS